MLQYTHTYIYIIHTYTHTHVHRCTHIPGMHSHSLAHLRFIVRIHVISVCVHAHDNLFYINKQIYIYICIYTHTHICIHVHTLIHRQKSSSTPVGAEQVLLTASWQQFLVSWICLGCEAAIP